MTWATLGLLKNNPRLTIYENASRMKCTYLAHKTVTYSLTGAARLAIPTDSWLDQNPSSTSPTHQISDQMQLGPSAHL